MICPVELTSKMSAFQAARGKAHVGGRHGTGQPGVAVDVQVVGPALVNYNQDNVFPDAGRSVAADRILARTKRIRHIVELQTLGSSPPEPRSYSCGRCPRLPGVEKPQEVQDRREGAVFQLGLLEPAQSYGQSPENLSRNVAYPSSARLLLPKF